VSALRAFYGLLPSPPVDLFQFVLWEILSREALPARRDLTWLAFKRIPALTPDAVFRTPAKDLLDTIGLIGPNRESRLELIRAVVGEFKRHREALATVSGGRHGLRRAVRSLRRLSQLDSGIRQRALLFVGGYRVMPIDDEIARVVNRYAGTQPIIVKARPRPHDLTRSRRLARRWLLERLPTEVAAYQEAVAYLRHHAQHACLAYAPHCPVCPLAADCVAARVTR
jgi:hypothetical protein